MLAPSAASDHQPNRPRPRGRPRGSATQDLRQKHLGLPHFAFLRAWLQGFDLAQAWDRFLAFQGESGDLRHVRATRARLWMQLLDDAQALNDSLPPEQRIDDVLERLQSRESKPKLVELPSLETFCSEQGLELDFYSEQELLQLMREHYGLDQVRDESDQESFSQDGVQISPQVRALNTLQTYLAKPLLPTDSIALWVSAALSRRLALAGVATVDDLVRLQAACGPTWYRKVQGLGQVRADRLLGWLQSHGLLDAAAAKPVAEIVATAIVPLEQLGIPQALQGRSGGFRAMGPNAYGAECDQQAWDAWLRPYEGQPRTWETYRREIERFVLWAVLERSRALSAMTTADCLAYRDFLTRPPARWVSGGVRPRSAASWRPFRSGGLDPVSVRHGLGVVRNLYAAWLEAGYVVANPMATVLKQVKLPAPAADAKRGFTAEQWRWILAQVPVVAQGLRARRLAALLRLLTETGLRLDELVRARMGALEPIHLEPEPDSGHTEEELAYLLHVEGKGGKPRVVPMSAALVDQLLELHQLVDQVNPAAGSCADLERPLLGALQGPVGQRGGEARVAMGRAGLYKLLKRFFRRLARLAVKQWRQDADRLAAASTHWLRHTFARQAIAQDAPIGVVQEVLGHSSQRTTSEIYVLQERTRLVRAMLQVHRTGRT